jgi:mannobiose 2-epimerase
MRPRASIEACDRALATAFTLDLRAPAVERVAAALHDGSPLAAPAWRRASISGTAPLVYCYLRDSGALRDVSRTAAGWLEAEFERNALRVAVQRAAAGRLTTVLAEREIPVVWMKGLWLSSDVYELPGMRSMDDVDLLVPRERFDEAERLLLAEGLERNPVTRITGSSPHASPLQRLGASDGEIGNLSLDLHHEVFPPHECDWATDLVWSQSAPAARQGLEVLLPGPEAGVQLIAIHLFKHHLDPKHRLKAAADLAALVRRHDGRLDWERLRAAAQDPLTAAALWMVLTASEVPALNAGAAELSVICRARLEQLGLAARTERLLRVGAPMGRVRAEDASLVSYGARGSHVKALPVLAARLFSRERIAKLQARRAGRLFRSESAAELPGGGRLHSDGVARRSARRLRKALPGSNWRYTLTTYLAGRLEHEVKRRAATSAGVKLGVTETRGIFRAAGRRLSTKVPLSLWSAYDGARSLGRLLREEHPRRLRTRAAPGGHSEQGPPPRLDSAWFRSHIVDDLLPFYQRHAVDEACGGFFNHLDRRGTPVTDGRKRAAMQARFVYAFSVGFELTGRPEHRRLAERGVRFLLESCWDRDHGGWFRYLSREGAPLDRRKDLFEQAYVLIGLLEYCRVSGDAEALTRALQTVALLEAHAWDRELGGYVERLDRAWSVTSGRKTACVQIDMLMALEALHKVHPAAAQLSRLGQLADALASRMIDPRRDTLLETFDRRWAYDPARTGDRVRIGHSLKAAALLLRMHELTAPPDHRQAAGRLLERCLDRAWDGRFGGFYQHLYRTGWLASDVKEWWAQCDGMIALLAMHRATGEPLLLRRFHELAEFVRRHFQDPVHGEWFHSCKRDGAVLDDRKATLGKAGFHTVEACLHAHRQLAELEESHEL